MHSNSQLFGLQLGSDHQATIAALNNHASVVSSTRKIASPEFHSCFARFIELLDASDWKMDYLEGNPTGVTAAYYAFLDSMANEVRDVPQGNA